MNELICSCCLAATRIFQNGFKCDVCDHFQRKLPFNPQSRYSDLKDRNPALSDEARIKFAERLNFLKPFLKDGLNILEIGCAEGSLGILIKKEFKLNYTGIEPSLDSTSAVKGIDKVVSDIKDLGLARYDLILSFHVLEHIEDVQNALIIWKTHLKDEKSLMVLEVPHHSGNSYVEIDQNIEHAHQFSTSSLALLQKNSGFDLNQMRTGFFESSNYRDSIRTISSLKVSTAILREKFLKKVHKKLGHDFLIWGTGGDFTTYLAPYLADLKYSGLVDAKPGNRKDVINPDKADFQGRKVLISSLRFKSEIKEHLFSLGVDEKNIFGLDDLFRWLDE